MKKLLLAAVAAAAVLVSAPARADFAADARNHGYNSGAYELLCEDKLELIDPKLRAQLDRKYRNTTEFRFAYDQFVERAAIIERRGWNKSADIACATAGRSQPGRPHWLAPAE